MPTPDPGYVTRYLASKEPRRKDASSGCSLHHLRDAELNEGLAPLLAPFINAYRPHGEVPTAADLRETGYELIRSETFTDDLKEVYWELKGYYPEENPNLATND